MYWIIISTGLRRTLSVDDGGKFRQPISIRHLEATMGMFTFFFCCVCVQRLVCLLFILTAVASDSCRCPGCVRLSLALHACVEFCVGPYPTLR